VQCNKHSYTANKADQYTQCKMNVILEQCWNNADTFSTLITNWRTQH